MVTSTAIAGYSHIAICVKDVDRAVKFYGETLGFEELERPGSIDIPGAWFKIGSLQLHLIGHTQVPHVDTGIGAHIALHIPTADFASTVEDLRGKGVEVVIDPAQRPDDKIWAAFIKDTEGNTIELTDMGPLS